MLLGAEAITNVSAEGMTESVTLCELAPKQGSERNRPVVSPVENIRIRDSINHPPLFLNYLLLLDGRESVQFEPIRLDGPGHLEPFLDRDRFDQEGASAEAIAFIDIVNVI